MDLKDFLRANPSFRVFDRSSDQPRVLSFIAKSPMKIGGLNLFYDRSPDFQSLLRAQGASFVSILSEFENQLKIIFSFSIAKRWYNGQLINFAYAADFRTDHSRYAAKLWRNHFAEVVSSLKQDPDYGSPQFILTAILKKNSQALANFVQTKKKLGFRYDFLSELQMVNVFARMPFNIYRSKIITKFATTEDQDMLRSFLYEAEKHKLGGANFDGTSGDDWNFRRQTWPAFEVEKFLVQKNSKGQIVACTLPWNPGYAKRMTLSQIPFGFKLIFIFLNSLGIRKIKEATSLRTLYLTHLNFSSSVDQSDSVRSFLEFIFANHCEFDLISFADRGHLAKKLKGYFLHKTAVMLFAISLPDEPVPQVGDAEIGFEMGLV